MRALLVLGCKVHDHGVSTLLESRLECALRIADQHRYLPIVVSGAGEAEAMAQWLVAHGIPKSRVVVEPTATSTNENIERASALLPEATRWWIGTSDFHVWRTRMWAWHLGVRAKVTGARTPAEVRVKNYVREMGALPHSALRVAWRRLKWRLVHYT
ncbi:YdcF family protein [Corynebacterium renale]|uniref:DUF218 domain-containing protein n=1 Tax=Corynebacterium renale TaxID=1724 RepID=A0A2A9DMH0_9CORY|nr:YdcF family protein [Corynebacterium renale]PFG27109.1 DUF218 domain-containing protein [Corynebacterium renale]SQI24116.1 DUF218 domain [Corynebacterium renale]